MAQTIKIDIGGIPAGQIIFNDAPAQLIASRTATGFNLSIPATVELEYTDSSKPCPMLSFAVQYPLIGHLALRWSLVL